MKIIFNTEEYNLELFPQIEDIPYSNSLKCRCGYGSVLESKSYNLVGYCETRNGFMGVMECQKCFEKYRHHIVGFSNRYDIEEFKKDAGIKLHLQNFKKP